jgi:PBP1b-binding outer membrane lipoprotein LpoB
MKGVLFVLLTLMVILVMSCSSEPQTKTTTTTTTTVTTTTQPSTSSVAAVQPTTSVVPAASAAPAERKVNTRIPQFARDAVKKTPEGVLVGIGTARMATTSQSMTTASARARAEISRQMITMVEDMIRDFTAGSEVDRSSVLQFSENISVLLSKSTLQGSSVVDIDFDDNGNAWSVVMFGRTNTENEIKQAQAQAKLAVPKMASFDAEERMHAAFDRVLATELGYSDKD